MQDEHVNLLAGDVNVPPNSHDFWKVRLHGAFTIPREILGLIQRDQNCHHETWLRVDLAGDRYAHGSRRNHDHRVHLKERSCPFPPTKEKGMMTEVTTHSHFYRRHVNFCFHKQAQLTILMLTCGFHQALRQQTRRRRKSSMLIKHRTRTITPTSGTLRVRKAWCLHCFFASALACLARSTFVTSQKRILFLTKCTLSLRRSLCLS